MEKKERNGLDKAQQYALAVRVAGLVLRVAAMIADWLNGGSGPWRW